MRFTTFVSFVKLASDYVGCGPWEKRCVVSFLLFALCMILKFILLKLCVVAFKIAKAETTTISLQKLHKPCYLERAETILVKDRKLKAFTTEFYNRLSH